jgi:2-dehydro-3-deoxygluconokinase
MRAARSFGTIVSYDLNYRASLWQVVGKSRAAAVNRELVNAVDVLFGNEEDFTAALGFDVDDLDDNFTTFDVDSYRRMFERVSLAYPQLKVIATTLRNAKTATRNDWAALAYCDGQLYRSAVRDDLEIYDRVGGGDSFASGLIFGLLSGKDLQWAVDCGAAHGALAMTTPGDVSMATVDEVERTMRGSSARVTR